MATALEFLKEQLSGVGGFMATALEFLKEQLSAVGGLIANALEFLMEQLSGVGRLIATALEFVVQKLEALLPPESSSDTVHSWVQPVMPLLSFLSLPILQKYFVSILQFFPCGCFVLAGYTMIACAKASYWPIVLTWSGGKMMKAPGRQGLRISRAVFESNPRSYFRALHANAPFLGESFMSTSFIVGGGLVAAVEVLLMLL